MCEIEFQLAAGGVWELMTVQDALMNGPLTGPGDPSYTRDWRCQEKVTGGNLSPPLSLSRPAIHSLIIYPDRRLLKVPNMSSPAVSLPMAARNHSVCHTSET